MLYQLGYAGKSKTKLKTWDSQKTKWTQQKKRKKIDEWVVKINTEKSHINLI